MPPPQAAFDDGGVDSPPCTAQAPHGETPAKVPRRRELPWEAAAGGGAAAGAAVVAPPSGDGWLAKRPAPPGDGSGQKASKPQPKAKRKSTAARKQEPPSDNDGLRPTPNPGAIAAPSALPASLDRALLPFQRAGVAFAVRRGGRALIGDDMGLGKTIQAIATCCAFRDDWPVLIVAPNSVRLVWADELERWVPDIGPGGVNVIQTGSDVHSLKQGSASFHIVTYGLLARASPVRNFIREQVRFKMIVIDESHMMKNRNALRTRELMHVVKDCNRVILLSGTPALARPLELYTQVEAVSPGMFASYTAFTSRYCNAKWTPWGIDLSGASHLDELHSKLRSVMVRRLKADVLEELPSKRRQRVQLEIGESASEACVKMKEELQNCGEDDQWERRMLVKSLYTESAVAKADAVGEYVEDLINGGCKFLVFAHHRTMMDALEQVAVRCKVGYIRIDGSVPSTERQRQTALFQSDPTVRVAILGLMAAGVGITLTAASTVVFAELHWTPGILVQAEDRAHRIGQKSSVNVHYLVATGTIDDIIWPSVAHKVEVVSTMCDGRRSYLVAKLASADATKGEVADPQAATALAAGAGDDEGAIDVDDLVAISTSRAPAKAEAERRGGEARGSSYSVLSMLQGRGPKKGGSSKWACGSCTTRNSEDAEACTECGAERVAAPAAALPKRGALVHASTKEGADADAIEEASGAEEQEEDLGTNLAFCVTRTTGRVHLLDAEGRPLAVNFKLGDWETVRQKGDFPEGSVLREEGEQRAVDRFLREWASLRPTEQRQLMDQTLRLPIRGHLQKRILAAAAARSTQRRAGRPPAPKAPVGEEAAAACQWCGGPRAEADAESAYCSRSCEEKDRVRSDPAFARKLLFSQEKGVCRMCGLDAHALFERVVKMSPPERHQELLRAGFTLSTPLLERPTEGMMWQADHIKPVAEGGGEADLTNLRTLCTVCHARETKRLHGRLKCAAWAGNSSDIRDCVKRAAGAADGDGAKRRRMSRKGAPPGGGPALPVVIDVE